MAFTGWPAEAIDFFDGLEEDNSKPYWEANKPVYEQAVKAPMLQLLEELAGEFGPGHMFRPYRDVRFSKDKTPYKTNIAARVGAVGYVSISAAGLDAGSGMFHMAPDQLERFRRAVDNDCTGRELDEICAALRGKKHDFISIGQLKTAPKGYAKDHPRIEVLRHKGFAVWHQWPVEPWLHTPKAKDRVVSLLRAAEPLNRWLDEHVGESQLEFSR
jgi:uncharacterized protein (TIGR02453 family)